MIKAILMSLCLVMGYASVHAEETVGEKAEAKAHDAKRGMKKGMHHTKEAMCMEGDAKCAAKKAGHRMDEGGDYAKDKAQETKNAVDHK